MLIPEVLGSDSKLHPFAFQAYTLASIKVPQVKLNGEADRVDIGIRQQSYEITEASYPLQYVVCSMYVPEESAIVTLQAEIGELFEVGATQAIFTS